MTVTNNSQPVRSAAGPAVDTWWCGWGHHRYAAAAADALRRGITSRSPLTSHHHHHLALARARTSHSRISLGMDRTTGRSSRQAQAQASGRYRARSVGCSINLPACFGLPPSAVLSEPSIPDGGLSRACADELARRPQSGSQLKRLSQITYLSISKHKTNFKGDACIDDHLV